MRSASMKDVAILAKVSQATVSRAINKPDCVDDETLGRIQSAIASLGYVPDGVAQSLRTQKSRTVGMCIPTLDFSTFGGTVETVQTELRTAGYTLLLSVCGYDIKQEAADITAMVRRGVDGIVLIGGQHDPALFALLTSRGIPYVLLWSTHQEHPSVGFDHRRAMVRLVTYLIDLGHTRIGAIMSNIQFNDRIRDRLLGVGDALAARGLPFPKDYQMVVKVGLNSAGQATADLLSLRQPPTAIVCANDVVAAGAVLECQRRGLVVPRDISVTGFSAQEIGEAQTPPITTVETPVDVMGQRAVDYLLRSIAGEAAELQELLPTEILKRGSTAPPPSSMAHAKSRHGSAKKKATHGSR